jgi:hypothetical protein
MEDASKQEAVNAVGEFFSLLDILAKDLRNCETLLKEANDVNGAQFSARVSIRCLFALIEGCIFQLKQMALHIGNLRRVDFSAGELTYLTEEEFSLDENIKISARPITIPLQKNLRFAFSMFAKACGAEFSLDVGGAGWQSFRIAVKVRNRLMHPKHPRDTVIMEEEMLAASKTSLWLVTSLAELFSHLGLPIPESELIH